MIQENIPIYERILEEAFELTNTSSTDVSNAAYSKMSVEEKTQDILTPKILAHREANVPTIFIRFIEDQSLLTEAIYYPYLAINSFWVMLEAYYGNLSLTNEQLKEQIKTDCVYMTATLINSIYERMAISMSWIPNEIINQWLKKVREVNVQQGFPVSKKEINIIKNQTSEGHKKEIDNYWKQKETFGLNNKCIRLAEEYPKILKHWQTLNVISRRFEKPDNTIDVQDWRKYAKPDEFSDTPDDLLDELEFMMTRDVWKLAIEHTARRVKLFKVDGVKEDILEKRRQGIMKTGYDSNYLLSLINQ